MKPGEVIAERFVVEALAGIGGMGSVYRGRDSQSGEAVAIKVLTDPERSAFRFEREAELLERLVHPNIVRYVAHGVWQDRPYLVLEWLTGEDLETRLGRQGLTVAEGVTLVSRAAEALGAAHALGVIHRDIKPSNLFLVGGSPARVKVLDFGIARFAATSATRTGAMLGTPAYMSPEQARGERDLDARSDVFSLGCVLFECLVGRPPFVADNPIAIVGKIALEDAPRVHSLVSDVPATLDALVSIMLSRDRDARPRSGSVVASALGELGALDDDRRPAPVARAAALTTSEQRLLGVVVVDALGSHAADAANAPTLVSLEADATLHRIAAVVQAHGGRLQTLAGGSVVAVFTASSGLTDQAGRAARCALALRDAVADAGIAVSVGRGVITGTIPMGEVVERAVALATAHGRPEIAVDEPTARLLAARFHVAPRDEAWRLFAEASGRALLLGRPTRLVGRDAELQALTGALDASIDERRSGVVVIAAPAGLGKSRLVAELCAALPPGVVAWKGACDPMGARTPLGPLARALREAVGIQDGEPRAEQWRKLERRAGEHASTEFLAELIGAPRETGSVQLAAARRDPFLMGDQMLAAFVDFVAIQTRERPLLLVLEDMHWGDSATLKYASEAVARLRDHSLVLLLTGRPEMFELFPGLHELADLLDMRLKKLPRRGALEIVKDALGARADEALADQLVRQADGNPLFLEELVRAAADGRSEAPDTVIAMLQARLESLETDARRVLRAASVFGEALWEDGVIALLGGPERAGDARGWLAELVRREVLVRRPGGRYRDQSELAFRHSLLQNAAYLMLTEADRKLGHRLAAEWLLQVGESDPAVLALHLGRAEDERAAEWSLKAAEQAQSANDFERALEIAERALEAHPSGELGGRLARLVAEASEWKGNVERAESAARIALAELPAGSNEWYDAAARAAVLACRRGERDELFELAVRMDQQPIADEAAVLSSAVPRLVHHLLRAQRTDLVEALLLRLARVREAASDDPQLECALEVTLAWKTLFEGDIFASLTHDLAAARAAERAGNLRAACKYRAGAGYEQLLLGDYEAAVQTLEESIAIAQRFGLSLVELEARHNLGLALAYLGRLDDARSVETAAAEEFSKQGDWRMHGACQLYLSIVYELSGELELAERALARTLELFQDSPANLAYAEGRLSSLLLQRGDSRGALQVAERGMERLERLHGLEDGEQTLRLAHAAALAACGRRDEARVAAAAARARLLEKAHQIKDEAARRRFLARVPENAATLRLWDALASD